MRIALVLGSGGARGYAHIGVIDELKDRGHEIVTIAGTSMGAVIGGLEAAGGLPGFSQWAQSLTYFSMLRQMDVTLTGAGMVKAARIIEKIDEFCGKACIEDLPIPFTAVATDITARREVWFQRGPLSSAIRASMALPGFITPVIMNDHILVDGGVYNPVPVAPTFAVPSDLTVAVSLGGRQGLPEPSMSNADAADVRTDAEVETGHYDMADKHGDAEHSGQTLEEVSNRLSEVEGTDEVEGRIPEDLNAEISGPEGVVDARRANGFRYLQELERIAESGRWQLPREVLREFSSRFTVPRAGESAEATAETVAEALVAPSTSEVLHMSLTAMQEMIERFRVAVTPVNVQITVPRSAASTYDFHRAQEIIPVGRQLAREAFDAAGI
ncbi:MULTISPECIES: patatin-like phospholipase family protein [unclassified Actinobaculum]|uniref:patatin-like phospholipase family protein n=1 Tax=unclassified Actinobaculum TaxID=2609299 RepID=UPI000D5263E3|nr:MULTISPECIES: patatin-like phospholipase family protein [unclassified Actinobaculum]AWE41905.1 esterase [Actinobaculum sp. 313]RTE50180.1 esterase [Actinobaculum sp. 352]